MSLLSGIKTRDWESTFDTWCRGPSQTEQERCERAVSAISSASKDSSGLASRAVRTVAQGSYANRTNVRLNSDVDVAVVCSDTIEVHYPSGVTHASAGLVPATYFFAQYKNDVEAALVTRFGRPNVKRSNRAIDVNENTYRVDADAVPCFEYRHYYYTAAGALDFHRGTALYPDDRGPRVINFPQQQYDNGVIKNDTTGRRFKKVVRIVKRLRDEMNDRKIATAEPIASFLVESLLWNAPDHLFQGNTWVSIVKDILAHLWEQTREDATCSHWTEENGIKFLFHSSQKWTRDQANQFLYAAWNYVNA